MIRIPVGAAPDYDVLIGRNLLGKLPALLGPEVRQVLVVYPEPLIDKAEKVLSVLADAGYLSHRFPVPDAEAQKTLEIAAAAWAKLGLLEFSRSDAVVSVGGGATTDLGGFIAASWLRGIKVVQVATSVVGMVDAAIGGKTGINTAEGKNLVGAFYLPAGVICDLDLLETLPHSEFIAGLAEVVKTGFIADPEILTLIRANAAQLAAWPANAQQILPVVQQLVARSVAVKAQIVGADLREAGAREYLNYGHTMGHAIELAEHFRWRHGMAVSVGMIFVAELAHAAGLASADILNQHYEILTSLGLPVHYHGDFDPEQRWTELQTAMRRDKKTRGAKLRFIVLNEIGEPTRLVAPDPSLLDAAYRKITE